MARGQQKVQAQQKNLKKAAEAKKREGIDQKKEGLKALHYTCTVCKTQVPDAKTYKMHFENKHPKSPLPAELQGDSAAS